MSLRQEELLIKKYKLKDCPIKKYQPFLAGLDPEHIASLMKEQFYNPNLFKAIECVVDLIIDHSVSRVKKYQRIKHWFTSLELEKENGTYSFITKLETEPVFVLKVSKDGGPEILHELFIGLFGTNQLRKLTPNFSYLFGGFRCTYPIIESSEKKLREEKVKVISYCEPSPTKFSLFGVKRIEVPYIIYQNEYLSISLKEYLRTCSGEDFFKILIQHLISFFFAYNGIGFVHNNDGAENTIVQTLIEKYPISYATTSLTTDKLAVSIDYSLSRIEYKDKSYGPYIPEYGIFPDIPLPINDAFKFIFSSLHWMITYKNKKCFNMAKGLASFFGDFFTKKDIYIAIGKYIEDDFYYITLTEDKLPDFLKFMRTDTVPSSSITEEEIDKWFRARDFNYSTLINFARDIFDPLKPQENTQTEAFYLTYKDLPRSLFSHLEAHSFYDFYDIYTSGRKDITFTMSSYVKALDDYKKEQTNKLDGYEFNADSIDPAKNIQGLSLEYIDRFADEYRENFDFVARAYDFYNDIEFSLKIGSFVASQFKEEKKDLSNYLKSSGVLLKKWLPRLRKGIEVIKKDLKYWNKISKNIPENLIVKLNWFIEVFPEAAKVFK